MQDLQTLFNELELLKDERAGIQKDYKDMLANDSEYQRLKDAYDTARIEKNAAEAAIKASMGGSFDRVEEIKVETDAIKEMISDIVITSLAKGLPIPEVTDRNHQPYIPAYTAKLQKVK
jgi:septal ring factor EnvC (AmiA/AmiB activator)